MAAATGSSARLGGSRTSTGTTRCTTTSTSCGAALSRENCTAGSCRARASSPPSRLRTRGA
eukprot:7599413-Lingulodinium_polyedra.AAC.1